MIEYIHGQLAELTPAYAVVDCHGVGYLLAITLTAYTELQDKKEAHLLVYEAIREDAYQLYGFVSRQERELFRELIGVSGVGANTARMILSSIPAPELASVIIAGDHTRPRAVKGIGAKTAQRIVVDLRDKIKPAGDVALAAIAAPAMSETFEEALAALVMLGFPRPAAQKALRKLFEADPHIKVELAIKKALAML